MSRLDHPQLTAVIVSLEPLVELFERAGHRLYLVGGQVRDAVVARPLSNDVDLTTDALPDEIERILRDWATAVWTQGARFGTVGALHGGVTYEITTHRREAYRVHSRKPTVEFSSDIVDDLSRRDFTVNAMAIELPSGEFVDPFDGRGDLARRVLRTPLDPDVSFSDDPLRMLRAARFCAAYDLTPTDELLEALGRLASRLEIVSRERIRDELTKLMVLRAPGSAISLLADRGVMARALPGLTLTEAACRRVDAAPAEFVTRLAVLFDEAGVEGPAQERRLRDLRLSSVEIREVRLTMRAMSAVSGASSAGEVTELTLAELRRLLVEHHERLDTAIGVAAIPREVGRALSARLEMLRAAEDIDALRGPPLSGAEVMDELGIDSGPEVGAALAMLHESQLTEGPLSPQRARALLRLWRDHRT